MLRCQRLFWDEDATVRVERIDQRDRERTRGAKPGAARNIGD